MWLVSLPGTAAAGGIGRFLCKAQDMGYRMGTVAWRWIDDDIADLNAMNTLHDARPHEPNMDDSTWTGEPVERVRINR